MITITVEKDKSCEMARVNDNVGNGMEGNYWDFHNGCHGINKFGAFNSVLGFVDALKRFHEKNGETVEIIKTTYKY